MAELSATPPGDPLRPPRPRWVAGARTARTRSTSSAPTCVTMLDRLGLARVVLLRAVDRRDGGPVAGHQRARADRPAHPALHGGAPAAGVGLARARRRRPRGGQPRGRRRCRPGALVHPGVRADRIPMSWRDIGHDDRASTPRATPAAARRSRPWTCAPGCRASRAPTLVVVRAPGPVDPARARRGDRRRRPGRAVEVLDPAAHLASVERADVVTSLIAEPPRRRGGGGERMSDELHDAGMKVRRAVLGDEHVDRAIERTTEFTAPFQEFITRYAWGGVWTRRGAGPPHAQRHHALGADRAGRARTRSRCTSAPRCATASPRRRSARCFIHTAIYAGVPAANSRVRDRPAR